MSKPWGLSATFDFDSLEDMHECASWLVENGYDSWAAAVSEAACILDPRNLTEEPPRPLTFKTEKRRNLKC